MKGGKIRIITVNDSNLSNVNKLMNNKNQKVIAKFYADWCGHCKDLNSRVMPEVERDIKKQSGDGIFLNVPEPMISKLNIIGDGVEGYPTIRLLVGGKKKKDYNGKREVKDLAKFIKKSLGKCRRTRKQKTKRKKKKRKGKTKKQKRKIEVRCAKDFLK